MLLKKKTTKQHNPGFFTSYFYRIPLQVTQVMLLSLGDSYPVCPRCKRTLEREYMCFCDRCGQRLAWDCFDFAAVVLAPYRQQR